MPFSLSCAGKPASSQELRINETRAKLIERQYRPIFSLICHLWKDSIFEEILPLWWCCPIFRPCQDWKPSLWKDVWCRKKQNKMV